MEADMTTLKRCLDYLDAHHVRYAHTVHSAAITAKQVAAAEYMPAHRMAKSVVICGEGFVFAVVPADTHVDLAQLPLFTIRKHCKTGHQNDGRWTNSACHGILGW